MGKGVCVKGSIKKAVVFFVIWFCAMAGEAKESTLKQLELSDFNKESLVKLSAMYGYARYFYPNPQLEKMNWHFFLENHTRKLVMLKSEQEVDTYLLKEFSVLIPELTFSSGELPLPETPHITDSFFVKENMLNTGYNRKAPVSSKIKKINDADKTVPVPGTVYCFPLYGDLYACFPPALYKLPPETPELKQTIRDKGFKRRLFF